eukprot:TRINITY_DN9674_c0_g1_i1.p2 TRINITY_DN9674_c0_g1~~TRINITY_DN9674_c0_g1_i1.p2  ORF type:complete len:126 (+),score=24.49 TRINITY_DN9674_c0_g1_i1:256-633(+)
MLRSLSLSRKSVVQYLTQRRSYISAGLKDSQKNKEPIPAQPSKQKFEPSDRNHRIEADASQTARKVGQKTSTSASAKGSNSEAVNAAQKVVEKEQHAPKMGKVEYSEGKQLNEYAKTDAKRDMYL